jgi:hypothetical protein
MGVNITIVQIRVESKTVSLIQRHVMNECWTRGGKDSCTAVRHLFTDIPCCELFGLLHARVCVCEFLHICIITWK